MIDVATLLPRPLVEVLGSVLLHFIWQGALVGILLFLALALLQRHSAQVRYGVGLLVLFGILVAPLATTLWLLATPPKATIPVAPQQPFERVAQASAPALTMVAQREVAAPPAPVRKFSLSSPTFPIKVVSPPPQTPGTIPVHESLPLLVTLWFAGVIILSLRLFTSWFVTQQLRSQAAVLAPQALQRTLGQLSKKLQVAKPIRLLESGIVNTPIVVGWLSPAILLPSKVVESFSLDKLEPILAHELAHIRRNDWLVIVLQRLAETLFFYHPVVWWLSKLLEKEREYSCDDIAAAACGNPRVYAQALAELELLRGAGPQFALAASSGPLLNRIRRLIMASSVKTHAQSPARAVAGTLVMATLLAVITLGFGPKLAFAQADYSEAPMLAERVAAGELPPVEERLPNNPVVVEPVERVGEYGGTWRTTLLGASDANWLRRTIGYEGLLRLSPDGVDIIPNAAEAFEANEDATEFTFTLREGLKWSDGEPFTTDDLLFWYEDVLLNDELTPVKPGWLRSGEALVVVEVQDERTVTFHFPEPNGLFLTYVASGDGTLLTRYARHYFETFHTDYNPDIDSLIAEAGVADWVALFQLRGGVSDWEAAHWQSPDMPTINAWIITNPYEGARVVAERNPYYFKVDTAGNQLPYLDRVTYDVVEDAEVMLLRAMAGEIDMQDRHIGTTPNRPVLFDNMERSDYRFFETVPSLVNRLLVYLNLNHQDPVKNEIFNNIDFRIALSHAINRQEIIDLVYVSQGEPWQSAPLPDTPFYNERLATQYTEYDPDLANEILDRHYSERDAQGFRLGPDGQRISISIETWDWVDEVELIAAHWREVGIETHVRVLERGFLFERTTAALHDATVWAGDGGGIESILRPQNFFPTSAGALHAPVWGEWYEEHGATPNEDIPAPVMEQMRLYDQVTVTADQEERYELFRQILEIAADEFPIIGISTPALGYGVVTNHFHNVPESMPHTGGVYPNPAPTNPSQYFIQQTP